ncbi:MAG: flagellar motor stator protein MotA, partial [Rhodospirillales bacterium]|nr:flagellar motor stator protein MotA [Rhodospirillales bacterium]
MLFIVGSVIVLGCVIGGYMAMGGKLAVLYQPFELVIIGGAAMGAFIIANPMPVIKKTGGALGQMMKGSSYTKESYLEL